MSAAVAVFLGTGLMAVSSPAEALIYVGGGYYCNVTVYDVGGEIQGWFYDNCFYDPPFGGGGNPGPNPDGYHPDPGGGGLGGNPGNCPNLVAPDDSSHLNLLPPMDPTDPGDTGGGGGSGNPGSECDGGGASTTTEVSAKLKCQLLHYGDLGMQPTQSVKKSNQYMYQNYATKEQIPSNVKLNMGSEWGMVYGSTYYDGTYNSNTKTTMYQAGFEAYNGPPITGSMGGDTPDNVISSMNAEEMALFTYAHESAHQNGVEVSAWQSGKQHPKANHYGISAVEALKAAKAENSDTCK